MSLYKLSYKRYSRKLAKTLNMSRGKINTRDGVIIRLENSEKEFFYAEAVTLPYFNTETIEQSIQTLDKLDGQISREKLKALNKTTPATKFALESAMILAEKKLIPIKQNISFPISKLITSNITAVKEINFGIEEGYQTFKLKIGIEDINKELQTLYSILNILPKNFNLRLDANGGLNYEQAKQWLKECESTQVEFIEQPLAPEKIEESIKLQKQTSTSIALDESVSCTEDVIKCYRKGWRGIYVVKVSRLQELERFIKWRDINNIDVVYSSALETSIATELSIQIAVNDKSNKRALGFGVSHWFENDGLYRHSTGPILSSIKNQEKIFQEIWEKH